MGVLEVNQVINLYESPGINLEWGDAHANAKCTPDFVIFQIVSTRLLALQCSKMLTNPMSTLTEYSLLLICTSSTSTKSPLQAENGKIQHFADDETDKVSLRMHQNRPFQVKTKAYQKMR